MTISIMDIRISTSTVILHIYTIHINFNNYLKKQFLDLRGFQIIN